MDTLLVFFGAVSLLDTVKAEALLLEDLEVFEDFEDFDDFDDFDVADVAAETTELCDDLLCSRCES